MGALNVEDEYAALVKPKLQAAFLQSFMTYLISLDPTTSISKTDINIEFKKFMQDKTGAQPNIGA